MPRRTRNSQAAGLLEEDVIKDESSLHELSLGDAHMMTEAQLLKFLAVDLDQGLTEEEVKKRQEKYGKNEFPQEEGKSLLRMILEQFQDGNSRSTACGHCQLKILLCCYSSSACSHSHRCRSCGPCPCVL